MKYLLFFLCLSTLLYSCDDGDVIDVELDFQRDLERCGDDESDTYILYETKTDPSESVSLLFPVAGNRDIFNPASNNSQKVLTINGSSIRFNYRSYDGDPDALLCQVLPDPGVSIISDYEAAAGAVATFTTTFEDDDNDGIPSDLEGRGLQAEDGSYPDAIDTDSDGLPDYKDADDDNDNVLTVNEEVEIDENGVLIALDTDEDGIPNYLDNNDDGDSVLTKDEDENGNLSLNDDFDENSPNLNTPRYLDPLATESFPQDEFRFTQFTRSLNIFVVINNASIEILNTDEIILGTYEMTRTLPIPEE